ncbi:MAG: hypothetical protein Q8M94_10250, partial [Ignavibacteria bacterium]|nr:hypothetical protein [Ignavibacteria bacterium]
MTDLKRNYTMSNPDLCILVGNMINCMTRDAAQFTGRGVTVVMRNAYKALGDAFAIFPSDEEYKGLVTIEVDLKAIIRTAATVKLQKISGYVEQKWGFASGQYSRLGITGIQRVSENAFLFRAREVARIASEYMGDLSPLGLTQGEIDDLTADASAFDEKIRSTNDAKAQRDVIARERTLKGNELYTFAVLYGKVGKLIWENVDSAKYDDYIIYDTSHPGLPKPQGLAAGWTPADPDITLSWDDVYGATRYEVFYSVVNIGSPSGNYNLLNRFTSSPQHIPFATNKRNY